MEFRKTIRATCTSFVALAILFFLPLLAFADLENPLRTRSIAEFIAAALKALVVVALPIITLFIVISGFMFVLARGNEGKLTEAKKNFVYVIIGALLILGAWVIATLIGGTVSQLVS